MIDDGWQRTTNDDALNTEQWDERLVGLEANKRFRYNTIVVRCRMLHAQMLKYAETSQMGLVQLSMQLYHIVPTVVCGSVYRGRVVGFSDGLLYVPAPRVERARRMDLQAVLPNAKTTMIAAASRYPLDDSMT